MTEQSQDLIIGGRRLAAVRHDAGGRDLVVFCHGFHGTRVGPNRWFVRTARRLAGLGVSSLRFDQYGSGDSDGDFSESSFADWVEVTAAIVIRERERGYRVALLGQSMGATAALLAAADLAEHVTSIVAWVPGAVIEAPDRESGWHEEGGQRVPWAFWKEAHMADLPARLQEIIAPALIFHAEHDVFVSPQNQAAITNAAPPRHEVVQLAGHGHSDWSVAQTKAVVARSVGFLADAFTYSRELADAV